MDFVDTCILEIFGAALLAFGVLFKAAISCEAASHNSPGPPSGDLSLFSLPLSLSLSLSRSCLSPFLPPSLPSCFPSPGAEMQQEEVEEHSRAVRQCINASLLRAQVPSCILRCYVRVRVRACVHSSVAMLISHGASVELMSARCLRGGRGLVHPTMGKTEVNGRPRSALSEKLRCTGTEKRACGRLCVAGKRYFPRHCNQQASTVTSRYSSP